MMKVMSVAKTTATVKVKKGSLAKNKYVRFVEKVNGRSAMQGFIWGSVKAGITGESIMHQIMTKTDAGMVMVPNSVLEFVAVSSLVTVGSLITEKMEPIPEDGKFTNDAEMVNGRLAMVGFIILCGVHFTN